MILSKTPVRIAFGGGGTDVEPYSSDYGGMVVNATINRYFRVFLSKSGENVIKIFSNDTFTPYKFRIIDKFNDISVKGDLIKAIVVYSQPHEGMDIYIHGEAPKKAGLGASASLTCAILGGIETLLKNPINFDHIAESAYEIEQNILKNEGGRQDQYAAVHGGLNCFEFLGGSKVQVYPLEISESFLKLIEENLILYYTGVPHLSGNLVKKQVNKYLNEKQKAKQYLDKLKDIGYQIKDALVEENFERFGTLLTRDWEVKTQFNPAITTKLMEDLNKAVMTNGGIGGRVCGAGGGGCMIWLVEKGKKEEILKKLRDKKGYSINFNFTKSGLEFLNV